MNVNDIAAFVNSIAPSIEGDDSGILVGDLRSKVKGIVVCWSPTLEVIKACKKLGCNLIIAHEWLLYYKSNNKWMEKERPTLAKKPNLRRLVNLLKSKITVVRYHRNLDTSEGGTADTLGEFLGFKTCVYKGFFTRVYRIEPTTLLDLVAFVSKKLQVDCDYYGASERPINHVGIACGGVGQTFTFAEEFLETPTQAIIFGETLEYTEIYTRELGYDYITTSHEASETPGLIKLAHRLKDNLLPTDIPIHFVSSSGKEHTLQFEKRF